jgi:hypothetical protein
MPSKLTVSEPVSCICEVPSAAIFDTKIEAIFFIGRFVPNYGLKI